MLWKIQHSAGCLIAVWFLHLAAPLNAAIFDNFTYTDNGTFITITDYPTSAVGPVNIPSTINGKPVTTISNFAFDNCTGLTSVTIPIGVTGILDGAFFNCSGLTDITIPSSVTSIGTKAFYGCNALTNVTIPSSVTSIGLSPFADSSGLISLSVDAANPNYTSNDGVLFNKTQTTLIQCPGGKPGNYTIPSSVTKIEVGSFLGCRELTNVTIPHGVTHIGLDAFIFCSGLTNVIIPSSVTTVGLQAFYGCSGLTTVIMPSTVTTIADSTFKNCSSLTGIYFQGNAPSLEGPDVFSGDVSLIVYYLPGTSGWPFIYGNRATVLVTNPLKIFQISQSLLPDGTQDLLTPAGDGIPNLHKYAFNMVGSGPGQASTVLIPNTQRVTNSGSAGLPLFEFQVNGETRLKWTYIRRKASTSPGITYLVEFADDLTSPAWATNPSATESVTNIDANFERVTLTDSTTNAPRRFTRVRVTSP